MKKGASYFVGTLTIVAIVMVFLPQANPSPAPTMSADDDTNTFKSIRAAVLKAAEPAFRSWLEHLDHGSISNYGFRSPEEIERAALGPPIPVFTPSRLGVETPSKSRIEATLDDRPTSWIVPVLVNRRIACVVIVDAVAGQSPKTVEFGKMYTANRLDAGIRILGWPPEKKWVDLRLVSFVDPTVDLLLLRNPDRAWVWVNLVGTTAADATILSSANINAMLGRLPKPAKDVP